MVPDSCTLPFGPDRAVVVQFQQFHLVPGVGCHQLRLRAAVSAPKWLPQNSTESLPILLTGMLYCANRGMIVVGPLVPRTWSVRAHNVEEHIVVLLSDDQVLALDHARNGSDLMLLIEMQATWLQEHQPGIPAGYQGRVTVSPAEWLAQLEQLGWEVGLIIRVPGPLVDAGGIAPVTTPGAPAMASRAQAAARLSKAKGELRDGQYENCASTCRLVLDSLRLLNPPTPASGFVNPDWPHCAHLIWPHLVVAGFPAKTGALIVEQGESFWRSVSRAELTTSKTVLYVGL